MNTPEQTPGHKSETTAESQVETGHHQPIDLKDYSALHKIAHTEMFPKDVDQDILEKAQEEYYSMYDQVAQRIDDLLPENHKDQSIPKSQRAVVPGSLEAFTFAALAQAYAGNHKGMSEVLGELAVASVDGGTNFMRAHNELQGLLNALGAIQSAQTKVQER